MNCDYRNIFDEIYERYYADIYGFAYYLTRNSDETEELFQETWFRVVKYLPRIENIRNKKAWILSITANLHRDMLRKKRIRRVFHKKSYFKDSIDEYDTGNIKGTIQPSMDEAERVDLMNEINRAIESLPAKQRRVFILKEIEGFKHAEIGDILKIPVGTVKSLHYRAIRHLQDKLSIYRIN